MPEGDGWSKGGSDLSAAPSSDKTAGDLVVQSALGLSSRVELEDVSNQIGIVCPR